MTVEEKLKNEIARRYGTESYFSSVSGIHPRTLSRALSDIQTASTKTVSTICQCLGISMDALMRGDLIYNKDVKQDNNKKEEEVKINLLDVLDEIKRRASGKDFTQHIYVPPENAYIPDDEDEAERIADDFDYIIFLADIRPHKKIR